MARRAVVNLARAMRRHQERVIAHNVQHGGRYAVVRKTDPLTLELTDAALTLVEDHNLVVARDLAYYISTGDVHVGDTVRVEMMRSRDEFYATDVHTP